MGLLRLNMITGTGTSKINGVETMFESLMIDRVPAQ